MSRRSVKPDREPETAAEWFVAIDASSPDDVAAARFSAWLDGSADREIALERCSAAADLARHLADDPDLRPAYDEVAAIAAGMRPTRASRLTPAFTSFAWGAAALLALAAGIALLSPVPQAVKDRDAPAPRTSSAASIVASAPPTDTAVVLPSLVVVDVSSVAVLPFARVPRDTRTALATRVSAELAAALASIPGLYVVAAPSAYANADLRASEIGAQLGTRAIVLGSVALAADRLQLSATVLDAATDEVLWQADYDRPIHELPAIQVELMDHIAAALVDPDRRARALALAARVERTLASFRPGVAPFE
jgi:TolB-like protein